MTEQEKREIVELEAHASENGWVAPLTDNDRDYLVYFRSVCKRYNIVPSRANRLEYEFVTRVAESVSVHKQIRQPP